MNIVILSFIYLTSLGMVFFNLDRFYKLFILNDKKVLREMRVEDYFGFNICLLFIIVQETLPSCIIFKIAIILPIVLYIISFVLSLSMNK